MRIAAALVCTLLLPAQTFRSGVEGVNVDVLVLDGNRPLSGLTVADFELRDSGVVQQIDSIALQDVPLNVMFALDVSESVAGVPLENLKEAALAAVQLLAPGDQAALLTFADHVKLRADWTADRARLAGAVIGATATGATALHDAAYAALTLRASTPGRTLVLVFSDGEDTASWMAGTSSLEIARRTDAVVYGVELRNETQWSPGYRVDFHSGLQTGIPNVRKPLLMERFLHALASDTGGQVLNAARSDQLRDRFVRIITEFRTRYLITYTPHGVEKNGWHPLQVTLKNRKGRVVARRGYLR